MSEYIFHKDKVLPKNCEVFVFGSNLASRHGAGAALVAARQFGASRNISFGYSKNDVSPCMHSYAIPTKDKNIQTLPPETIEIYVRKFIRDASIGQISNLIFFITRIGCGLAGYSDHQIAPMFRGSPTNCVFPIEWSRYL